MKKTFLLFTVFIMSIAGYSQHTELFGFSGYTFTDQIPIYGGSAKLHQGVNYGGGISYVVDNAYMVEVSYSYQDSRVTAYSHYYSYTIDVPASMHYYMLGGYRMVNPNEKVQLFTGMKLGGVTLAFPDGYTNSVTKFAMGLDAGFKVFFNKHIGIRGQASMNFPLTNLGGSLYIGSGGVSAGVSTYSPILQFSFLGGLVFKIGN